MFGKRQRIEELEKQNEELSRRVRETAEAKRALEVELEELGALEHLEVKERFNALVAERDAAAAEVASVKESLTALKRDLVLTDDALILQEVGVYQYRHPLDSAAQYKEELATVNQKIKDMVKGKTAVQASVSFTFNNSAAKGRTFVNDFSRLMLRAYNAEAENCVRVLKAGTLPAAEKRLSKTADVVERLGRLMDIRIAPAYHALRLRELQLTADYLVKQQEEKEAARAERERLREEEKARQEFRREQERLMKERTHYLNALEALKAQGDAAGVVELQKKMDDVDNALEGIREREANIRAGYVYVISNVGSFGERVVKIGMTRRLEPMDRIRELGDASVPFRYDVHALFFSEDAVSIETDLHRRLEDARVNRVNLRREFFYATPAEVRDLLLAQAGNLLDYVDAPEASEFYQSKRSRPSLQAASTAA